MLAAPAVADGVFPMHDHAGDSPQELSRERHLRVLIVDDNRDAADSLGMLARIWGHDAAVAYDPAAALVAARAEPPDVVFLDICLPGMDGFRLARELRQRLAARDSLFIAVSGYADPATCQRWQDEGFAYYLLKPVNPTLLHDMLLLRKMMLNEDRVLTAGR
jgi:CheY-like chemotaxis protein